MNAKGLANVYLCNNATTIRPIKYLFLHLAKKRLPKCVCFHFASKNAFCAAFVSVVVVVVFVDLTSAFQLQQLVQIFIPVLLNKQRQQQLKVSPLQLALCQLHATTNWQTNNNYKICHKMHNKTEKKK